jgi:hypothetical protein
MTLKISHKSIREVVLAPRAAVPGRPDATIGVKFLDIRAMALLRVSSTPDRTAIKGFLTRRGAATLGLRTPGIAAQTATAPEDARVMGVVPGTRGSGTTTIVLAFGACDQTQRVGLPTWVSRVGGGVGGWGESEWVLADVAAGGRVLVAVDVVVQARFGVGVLAGETQRGPGASMRIG